ncbi:helix-turn-helix transcriptional regulator [Megasphaera sp.]|uniref:helix-turn-helix transcriptional regulator n=1 Tax=Megasphaera sp. TaxID=2023260 RepID=UPI003522603D|nr:helix-turn-helix transcriptional regulator [Megasphaera elsdenii]
MINKLLEEKRNELKMTQEEVADKAGITRAYYSMIESGKKTPSPKIAQRIANIFNIEWTLFYTYE